MPELAYQRVLLKLSGESLGCPGEGVDLASLCRAVKNIKPLVEAGVQVGLMIGGGNLIRGATFASEGFEQETADYMGMTATIINGLALTHALNNSGVKAKLFSKLSMPTLIDDYTPEKAKAAFADYPVLVFSGGTGKPFFTTDTSAAQYAVDIDADILLKATKVDGIYSDDPCKNPEAERFSRLTYQEILDRDLKVMDRTAFEICQKAKMTMRIFDMNKPGVLHGIVMGDDEGTLVS